MNKWILISNFAHTRNFIPSLAPPPNFTASYTLVSRTSVSKFCHLGQGMLLHHWWWRAISLAHAQIVHMLIVLLSHLCTLYIAYSHCSAWVHKLHLGCIDLQLFLACMYAINYSKQLHPVCTVHRERGLQSPPRHQHVSAFDLVVCSLKLVSMHMMNALTFNMTAI